MTRKKKKSSLGVPLLIATIGTVASIAISKKIHVGFGIALAGLSLLHALQHKKSFRR
ncbi:MAG: hypothetical protein IKN12_11585 [Selenomonadaceae bacterium]|nr:hypothetical protein [Selenomonadaceae bacterium]